MALHPGPTASTLRYEVLPLASTTTAVWMPAQKWKKESILQTVAAAVKPV